MSGAGTNLNVGGTGPARKWGRAPNLRKVPEKFFGRAPPLFGFKSTISRFGECFRGGQYSLVSFFFRCSTHGAPRAKPFVKVGVGASAPVPYGVGATGSINFYAFLWF